MKSVIVQFNVFYFQRKNRYDVHVCRVEKLRNLTFNSPPTSIKCFAASPDLGAEKYRKITAEQVILFLWTKTVQLSLLDFYLLFYACMYVWKKNSPTLP